MTVTPGPLCHPGLVPPDSGLVRIEVEPAPPTLGLWLVAHAELIHLPRVRAVIDHITAAAKEQATFLRDGWTARPYVWPARWFSLR